MKHFFYAIAITCVAVEAAHAVTLYTYTGSGQLITFDGNTLNQLSGPPAGAHIGTQDLTVDENGRLFGQFRDTVVEYDPITLAVLNQRVHPAGFAGLAARNNVLYSLTRGTSGPALDQVSLVTFDADSLAQIGGPSPGASSHTDRVAFDENGRLFGVNGPGRLAEFDPITLTVLNETINASEGYAGLAVRNGILYTLSGQNDLLAFNADTLTQIGGPLANTGVSTKDLTFDSTGRLSGVFRNDFGAVVAEFDPATLAILNQRTVVAGFSGLAATNVNSIAIPEPATAGFFVLALFALARRTSASRVNNN